MGRSNKKTTLNILLIAFLVFILGYGLFRAKNLILGVRIENVNIENVANSNIIKISGKAKNALNLTLQGREISIDKEGNWIETIALLPGYNVIEIRALDKFGKEDQKNYELIHAQAEEELYDQEES